MHIEEFGPGEDKWTEYRQAQKADNEPSFAVKHGTKVSTWLIVVVLIMAATQMQPSFADLIVLPLMAALGFCVQYFAQRGN